VRIVDYAGHLPIGLLSDAVIRRPIRRGDVIGMDDIEIPDSLALRAWREIEGRVLGAGGNRRSALAS
jgi:predicted homoserine dehydrogenase-like protein